MFLKDVLHSGDVQCEMRENKGHEGKILLIEFITTRYIEINKRNIHVNIIWNLYVIGLN